MDYYCIDLPAYHGRHAKQMSLSTVLSYKVGEFSGQRIPTVSYYVGLRSYYGPYTPGTIHTLFSIRCAKLHIFTTTLTSHRLTGLQGLHSTVFFVCGAQKLSCKRSLLCPEGAFGAFVRANTGSSGYNSTPTCADAGGQNRVVK